MILKKWFWSQVLGEGWGWEVTEVKRPLSDTEEAHHLPHHTAPMGKPKWILLTLQENLH